jgi:outer membrane protein assembly factor BamB
MSKWRQSATVRGMKSGRLVRGLREVRNVLGVLATGLLAVVVSAQDKASGAKNDDTERVLWTYSPSGAQFTEVVVKDGVAVALDRAGKIHGVDAATGKKLWVTKKRFSMSYGFGLALSPLASFDAVMIGSDDGFFALQRATGKELWHTEIELGVAGPACTSKAVIAGSADGKVYACDLTTGRILWEHEYVEDAPADPKGFSGDRARFQGRPARPCAATTDGKIVVLSVFDQCRTLALDVATGKRLWSYNTQGWMGGTATIGARNVFAGSQDKHMYAVDKQMGKLAWKVKTGGRVNSGGTPGQRFTYFGSCDANLYAVDTAVGHVAWKFATDHAEGYGAPIYSRPLVSKHTVYLAAMSGKVYAVDRKTGKLRWKMTPVPNSEPNCDLVESDGRLFLTTRKDGKKGVSAVVAIDPK